MEYKFSVTKHYVSNWSLTEGVREILQNAIDSSGKMEIDVGDDYISISNKNIKIPLKTLLLGCGTKTNDNDKVGGHSEGSLLAIMTLIREGYSLDITNSNEKWIPSFKYDEAIQEEILCIETQPCNETDCLTYVISGLSHNEITELQDEFLDLRPKNKDNYNSIQTYYGEIILDEEYSGKMFVEGLPIAKDDNFKYGYNFKSKFVDLDRDRKSINIYQLKKLTASAIADLDENNFNLIDECIDKGSLDGEYIKDNNVSISNEEEYAKYLMKRFDIKDNTVVCTEGKAFDILTRQSKDENFEVKEMPKKIYADIINEYHGFSNNIVTETKNKLKDLDKKEEAQINYDCSDYKLFKEWLEQYKNDLSEEAIDEFNDLLSNIEPSGFNLIKDDM